MSEQISVSAIVDLESRQDEVLRRLDELEAQIERALIEFTAVAKKAPGACADRGTDKACNACKVVSFAPIQMPGLVDGAQQPQT
jgi:hypothetical protein